MVILEDHKTPENKEVSEGLCRCSSAISQVFRTLTEPYLGSREANAAFLFQSNYDATNLIMGCAPAEAV